MRAACPSYIGRPGKQPAGSIQAESAPKVGYRGVGERLEAVEHGSYAPDGPLGAMQHSSESRLLEPFTTLCWAVARVPAESSGVICVHTPLAAGALVELGAENSRMSEYESAVN